MTIATENEGTCFLCHHNFSDVAMPNHLQNCAKTNALSHNKKANLIKNFRIKIFSGKEFWLYIDISTNAKLQDLDDFLRIIWVECCDHLSAFYINRTSCDMKKTINNVFIKGTNFYYDYDFGSTTRLQGKVIAWYQGVVNNKIRLLARNNMPSLKCSTCAVKPKFICQSCNDLCCSICFKEHDCGYGNETMLPVVNSPRMGICGYSGMEDKDNLKQFLS